MAPELAQRLWDGRTHVDYRRPAIRTARRPIQGDAVGNAVKVQDALRWESRQ